MHHRPIPPPHTPHPTAAHPPTDLDDVHVLEREAHLGQHLGRRVRRPQQQLLEGVHRHELPGPDDGLGREPERQGFFLGRDEGGRGAVGEEGGVGRGVRPVGLWVGMGGGWVSLRSGLRVGMGDGRWMGGLSLRRRRPEWTQMDGCDGVRKRFFRGWLD